jgi:hypothetical protein
MDILCTIGNFMNCLFALRYSFSGCFKDAWQGLASYPIIRAEDSTVVSAWR